MDVGTNVTIRGMLRTTLAVRDFKQPRKFWHIQTVEAREDVLNRIGLLLGTSNWKRAVEWYMNSTH
jgi:hypothetical protein